MQRDFDLHFPSLEIAILGINEVGYESANQNITSGRDIPWLQDVDANSNDISDVWYDSWNITYRDVWVVDQDNEIVVKYNLTSNSLADDANFSYLKDSFLQTAATAPDSIWQSPVEPLDTNADQSISPLDALLVINKLGVYPNGELPESEGNVAPYIDPSGDGLVTPLDALLVINQLTVISSQSPATAPLDSSDAADLATNLTNPPGDASRVVDVAFAHLDQEDDTDEEGESSRLDAFLV